MRILFDINVLLDVFRRRVPFYAASAGALSKVAEREVTGCLPGHALTTLYYLVRQSGGREQAGEVIDWLLVHFEIVPQDKFLFARARTLEIQDFEDAALAASAEAAGCDLILTRNVADFLKSPVQAVTPAEFLAQKT
jgi:predicted nucleic acid-binding protein